MKKIIATVGPSLLKRIPLNSIHSDQNIYRINGAHGTIQEIEVYIQEIRTQVPDAQILMDLPGNKVRTKSLNNDGIDIIKGKEFKLTFSQTNYQDFYKHLTVGDTVWANDSIFKFEVKSIDIKNFEIIFYSHSTGRLLNNKGMHVRGIHEDIPFLFEQDKNLIKLANKYKIDYIGLSFVRNRQDIQLAKKLIKNSIIISKVETLSAVKNLDDILDEVEHILIDRGDLSTEIGIYKVPSYQKFIIDRALYYNKRVFLATHLLKSMEHNPLPTIAEIIDLYNTLKSGIYGVQMSEETAVGSYPEECINVINQTMQEIQTENIGVLDE